MLRSTKLFQNIAVKCSGATSTMAKRSFVSSAITNGGHGHGPSHAHAPAGPYDVPHHHQQTEEAWLFGINPHEEYKWEGWEGITFLTYVGAFAILFFGSLENDHNSFKNWAKAEALARREARANGEEIEFGKWYSEIEDKADYSFRHSNITIDVVEREDGAVSEEEE